MCCAALLIAEMYQVADVAGGYSQRIFVKQVTKVLEDLLAALKSQE